MGRRPAQWEGWKLQSALRASPKASHQVAGVLHLRGPEGSVAVSKADRSQQLCFARCEKCGGGRLRDVVWCHHLKLCTPEDVSEPQKLVCQLCAEDQYLCRLGLQPIRSQLQGEFMRLVDRGLQPSQWVWECNAIPDWHGRVDIAVLWPCKLVVQVDGEQHFPLHMRYSPARGTQQACDWECAARAVAASVPMLRLHWADLRQRPMACWGLMQWVMQLLHMAWRGAPLLVFSPAFNSMRVTHWVEHDSAYLQALAAHAGLTTAKHVSHAAQHGAIVLTR